MKFTHDELLNAVRIAGESGEPFTCAAVRDCLGVTSPDRETLNLFHRRFRTFQKEASEEVERVGKNAYRLKQGKRARARREAAAAAAATSPTTPAPVIEAVVRAEALETAPAAEPAIAARPEVLSQPEPAIVVAAPEPELVAVAPAPAPQVASQELAAEPAIAAKSDSAPLAIEPFIDPVFAPTPLDALDVPLQLIEAAFEDDILPEEPKQPETTESLAREAPVTRGGWRDFGRRVAEFFGRA